MKYVLYGHPIGYAHERSENVWSNNKEKLCKWQIELEKQHDVLPLFTGPVSLEVYFYFNPKNKNEITRRKKGISHQSRPSLTSLVNFIEDICRHRVLDAQAVIIDLTTKKIYDASERIEFYIKELK